MQQIADWLKKLGMAQYGQAFADNDIDFSVLRHLTDQHLKDLGVSLGHRLKMLQAIRDLGKASVAATLPSTPAAAEPSSHDGAERRQLTVMFCDLVGSTALSTRLDPEDLRSVIGAYHKRVAETVARFDGFVAKYMGDGALIYFGYPKAHEDDAERAVRAGLALIEAVGKLGVREPFEVRIGAATGLVVVGDIVGSGEAQERGVVGETPNLAARLQVLAEPDTMVIDASTRRLLGKLFEYSPLGTVSVKGFDNPVPAWQVLGAGATESRFEALRTTTTPLVGREEEIELLLRRWGRAKHNEGCAVLITGEPGIGKSRIAQTVQDQLHDEAQTLRYFCSPHHSDSALYPIIQRLERAAAFEPGDDAQARLGKLNALLAQMSTSPEDKAIFADLLALPGDGRYPKLDLAPQERRRRTIDAITHRLEMLARQQPVLAIFEDLHWIDPTSLDVLTRIIDRIRTLAVLLIVTFRPEFEPPWAGQPHVTLLALNRLPARICRAMLEQIAGNEQLPSDVVEEIIARTDGVPLFVEELTKAVVEAGTSEAARNQVSVVPSSAHTVPATLHASLMARLDRLGEAKEVAQVGAAIGREFSYELIAAVARCGEAQLVDALDRLSDAGLLFHEGAPPHATFLFKHALVQDAAYGTLLREVRRDLHARIAKTLNEKFHQISDIQPEILAHHYSEAGLHEPAADWWGKAAERAMHGSAFNEAIAHLDKAFKLVEGLADVPERRSFRLRLQTMYGHALFHVRGQAAPETIAAFTRAGELAAGVQDVTERFSTYWGLWVGSFARAELPAMRHIADAFLTDVQRLPRLPETSIAYRIFGVTCWFEGDYVAARLHLEKALALYDPERDHHLASRFGYDAGVIARCCLAFALWPMGDVDRALSLIDEALRVASKNEHVPTIAIAHAYASVLAAMVRRKPAEAAPLGETLRKLAREHGLPLFQATGMTVVGWARCCTGDQDGEALIREGWMRSREIDFRCYEPGVAMFVAEAEAKGGRVVEALATLDAQFETVDRTGERWLEAEAQRLRGELVLQHEPSNVVAAEAAFRRAIEIARAQKSRTFELRAALSFAKLYQQTNRHDAAAGFLSAALVGFNDGTEVPEVSKGRLLLDAVSSKKPPSRDLE
jgi:class 3 adenylate cyclase/tetratricopeptide (TPR) repeat protein